MSASWRWATRATLVGLGATATWTSWRGHPPRHGVPPLDYGLLGRWIGHMPRGRFTHDSIGAAAPVSEERKLGLVAHYSIGIGFAALLLALKPGWAERPALGPAMATGLGSTVAPFVLMQPASGLGLAASKTPEPPSLGLAACVPMPSTDWACTSPARPWRDSTGWASPARGTPCERSTWSVAAPGGRGAGGVP